MDLTTLSLLISRVLDVPTATEAAAGASVVVVDIINILSCFLVPAPDRCLSALVAR